MVGHVEIKSRIVRGFLFQEAVYPPNHREQSVTPCSYVTYVDRGCFEETCATQTSRRRIRSVHRHDPGELKQDLVGTTGTRCFTIASIARPKHEDIELVSRDLFRDLVVEAQGAFRTQQAAPDMERIAERVFRCELAERRAEPPGWVNKLRERIREQVHLPVQLDGLAGELGLNPNYVAQAFADWNGIGFRGYLEQLRADLAREMLLHSTLSLGEIALEAGFCEQSHMCRAIRRRYGSTPTQLRLVAQQGEASA